MGKKKNKTENEGEEKKNEAKEKNKENNAKKEGGEDEAITVVLKMDLHCEGCASKVFKTIRAFQGVESVVFEEGKEVKVVGKVDPAKLREKVEQKTRKKVELLSPAPAAVKSCDKENEKKKGEGTQDKKKENKSEEKKKKDKAENKPDEKKVKEPQVTTVVLKVKLHCQGCVQKIHKIVTKTKGYQDMKMDRQKDLVTITGEMDMKVLAETLKKHLKKDVEIVPEKKKEDGDKKKEGGGGGKKEKGEGGGEQGKGGQEGNPTLEVGLGEKMQGNIMQLQMGYPPNQYMYGPAHVGDPNLYHFNVGHAPQLFSDENPNACSVM